MKISLIACMGNGNQIGLNGSIPFESDLHRFKYLTLCKTLVMGRKTFESIGKALPGREIIVMSNQEGFNPDNVWVVKTAQQALQMAEFMKSQELMVCGGEGIYRAFEHIANRAYLTFVDYDGDADTYFPELSGAWSVHYKEASEKDEFHILEKV